MADEQTGGTTGDATSATAAPATNATSGTAAAASASSTTGDGTDLKAQLAEAKARAETLEKQLEKAIGRVGSTKHTLEEQLAAAKAEATEARAAAAAEAAKTAAAEKQAKHATALEAAMALAPPAMRALYREAARGMLLEADLTDPAAAAKAVHEKILAASPELVKQPVQHMPHAPNGAGGSRVGLSFTPGGKRLV